MASPAPPSKTPNAFRRGFRKTYRPFGFKKGYNFSLFFLTAGALLGFTLARIQYLNYNGLYLPDAAPGEGYWQSNGHYKKGLLLHLSCILPASFLIILQFVPVIRHKFILLHRISGYLIILLIATSNAGALMIARRGFGGTVEAQAGIGLLVVITTIGIALAYCNIKRLQIDQHRAWMLRSMFALASIITLRLILFLAALITTAMQNYYISFSCAQIAWFYTNDGTGDPLANYPECSSPSDNTTILPDTYVAVHADLNGRTEQIAASLDINFGMAIWLALFVHLVGVELYLRLTPGEARRLREVSAQRQRERWGGRGAKGDEGGEVQVQIGKGKGEKEVVV